LEQLKKTEWYNNIDEEAKKSCRESVDKGINELEVVIKNIKKNLIRQAEIKKDKEFLKPFIKYGILSLAIIVFFVLSSWHWQFKWWVKFMKWWNKPFSDWMMEDDEEQ
jgi:hypothetical protein